MFVGVHHNIFTQVCNAYQSISSTQEQRKSKAAFQRKPATTHCIAIELLKSVFASFLRGDGEFLKCVFWLFTGSWPLLDHPQTKVLFIMTSSTYTPKCPVMVMLFVMFAWLETACAFLGLGARLAPSPSAGPLQATVLSTPSATPYMPHMPSIRPIEHAAPAAGVQKEALPWLSSISPTRSLTYMPMFTHTLDVIKTLRMKSIGLDGKEYMTSKIKPARIGSMAFADERWRKVRMTYFDAGENVQVFNTVWYPGYQYDLPILGVDLISLGKGRVLSVVDFQPIHPTAEYADKYITPLESIRAKYPELQGNMSGKIYTDTSFFSKQMLFGRFKDESMVQPTVLPAYKEYLAAYLACMDSAIPDFSPEAMSRVQERQQAYDTYSALKDPAVGLFDAYFGKTWSHSFVHEFLFSLAQASDEKPAHAFQIDAAGNIARAQ